MQHLITQRIQQFVIIGMTACILLLTGCSSNEKRFVFKTPQEALNACHKELSKYRKVKTADIKKLASLTNTWLELQDSTLSCLMRDSTINASSVFAVDFFAVADSFRTEISRLALGEKRSLQDIVMLKIATAEGREKTIASEDFKKAVQFFSDMDSEKLYPDVNTTLSEYEKLLVTTTSFKKEKDLRDFLQKEDKCFRSLLVFLKDIPQEKLQGITNKTSELFDNLYKNTTADSQNKVNERVMLYLTMRFNRRIIQNAEVCRKDIKANVPLTETQSYNYRWMVIQPFMTIDSYSMAVLTEDQVKVLMNMAAELPKILAYIDGKDYDKSPAEETQRLNDILSEYILKSYLKNVL